MRKRWSPSLARSLSLAGLLGASVVALVMVATGVRAQTGAGGFDVRFFGAKGDGRTLDTDAINRAIAAAARAGGGAVRFPAGRYLSFSIRLASHVSLEIGPGAVIVAAVPGYRGGHYDLPEPNAFDRYSDFGHNHWRNALIWGEGLVEVAITGPGLIDGSGLTREGPGAPRDKGAGGDRPASMGPAPQSLVDNYERDVAAMNGLGDKAIAIKNSRNVTFRDFSVLNGGHFAFLLSGVDNLVMDGLRIDTNRDGVDLDVVRNARLSNLSVNTPNDDAIVLKSSYALGQLRPTENVTIVNCQVTGYDLGTFLDGGFGRTQALAPDKDRPTGRIKLGTESTGGFRNIAISNIVFDRSRGLALESVDGAVLEDVVIDNIVMREVTTAPIFLRVGDRRRAPPGRPIAGMRRVSISHVTASGIDPRYAAMIAGLPDAPVEDVVLSDIRLVYDSGPVAAPARPVPEAAKSYPEPSLFGPTPAWGLYLRHARGVTLRDIRLVKQGADARPAVVVEDVRGLDASGVSAAVGKAAPRPQTLDDAG